MEKKEYFQQIMGDKLKKKALWPLPHPYIYMF